MKKLFILMIFMFIFISLAISVNAIPISSCGNITALGTYELTKNLQSNGTCIWIQMSNVWLDLKGYTLTGNGSGNGVAAGAGGQSNVTVKNGKIKNFYNGVSIGANKCNLKNLTIYRDIPIDPYNSAGITASGFNNFLIENVIVSSYGNGIRLWGSDGSNNIVINSVFENSYIGIYAIQGINNTFKNVTIKNSSEYGIGLYEVSNFQIIDSNLFGSRYYDFYVEARSEAKCNHKLENVIGSGGYPIRFYNSSVNLQSQQLSELILCNADNSIINNIIILSPDNIQNNGVQVVQTNNAQITNINSSNNYNGFSLFNSSNNIFRSNTLNYNENGIQFYSSSKNNLVEENIISNNVEIGVHYSVACSYCRGSDNNTIKNNTINSNKYGIVVSNFYNKITDNILKDNSNSGINLDAIGAPLSGTRPNYTDVIGNVIENSIYGIKSSPLSFERVVYNRFLYNNLTNNNYGIYFSSNYVYNNILMKNIVDESSAYGIYLFGSDNNNITENIVTDSVSSGILITEGADNNLVLRNTAKGNSYGLRLYNNSGNKVIDNNFCFNVNADVECIICTAAEFTNNCCDNGDVCGGTCSPCPCSSPILLPEICSIYFTGESIGFNEGGNDMGGSIAFNWEFGDGSTSTSPNPTHIYTSGGQKTIILTLRDAGGLIDMYRTTILVVDKSKTGQEKYICAYINKPEWGESVYGIDIFFNATDTYAINAVCDGTSCSSISCIAGICKPQTKNGAITITGIPNWTGFQNINFSWVFDDGFVYKASGMLGAWFNKTFSDMGNHWAKLTASINPESVIETNFNIINQTSQKEIEKSEKDISWKYLIIVLILLLVILIIYLRLSKKRRKKKKL